MQCRWYTTKSRLTETCVSHHRMCSQYWAALHTAFVPGHPSAALPSLQLHWQMVSVMWMLSPMVAGSDKQLPMFEVLNAVWLLKDNESNCLGIRFGIPRYD